jgi:hypothetical protein
MSDRLSIFTTFDNGSKVLFRSASYDIFKRYGENRDRANRLEAMKRSACQAIFDKVIP